MPLVFQSYNIDELNYMKCPSCNVLYDNTSDKTITLKIVDARYHLLANNEFGSFDFHNGRVCLLVFV